MHKIKNTYFQLYITIAFLTKNTSIIHLVMYFNHKIYLIIFYTYFTFSFELMRLIVFLIHLNCYLRLSFLSKYLNFILISY